MPSVNPLTLVRLLKFKMFKNEHESTCVADVSYDPLDSSMTIEFKQRGTYRYTDVPLDVYTDFATAGSQGSYFNNYIRNTYSYERTA